MTDPDARLGDRLSGLLEQAAPGSPELDPASRTAAVVRRGRAARRRDRGVVAGTAAVVLALVVGVALAVGGGEPIDVASPPPAIGAAPCPAEPIDVSTLARVPELRDVTWVRACPPALGSRTDDPEWLPTEALVAEAAAAFAEDLAALPNHQLPAECAFMRPAFDPWALVVGRTDGGAVVIGTTTRNCSSVSVAGTDRGSKDVLAAFTGNLERQQSGHLTPGLDALACPSGGRLADGADTWNASFDIGSATAGVVCYDADPMGTVEYARAVGKLHPSVLATIRDDLAGNLTPQPNLARCADTGPQRLLLLADDAGDVAAYVDDRCSGGFSSVQGYWQPSAEAEAAISEALGGPSRG